ncbi:MAG: SPOR domain-containing protein [Myxococcales bacterium]|nr:SPOR domain-containing protein [Myxococcales bacterium]
MRDLDQIQERDEAGRSSKMMSIAMGALATACVLFGVGVVVGREQGDSRPVAREDPLARLDQLAQTSERPATTYAERLSAPSATAALGASQGVGGAATGTGPSAVIPGAPGAPGALGVTGGPSLANAVVGSPTAGLVRPGAPSLGDANARPVLLPSAGAPGGGGLLRVRESTEGMTAGATPSQPAPPGSDGPFTVQVSAFQNEPHAQSFAQQLRTRGYRAYVAQPSTGPGGVLWHRVRIGPFTSAREAGAFRADFERRERMVPLLISRAPNTAR